MATLILTKKVAFEKRTVLDAIQLFDRNYSQDLQENLRCTFLSVHTEIRVRNEKLV